MSDDFVNWIELHPILAQSAAILLTGLCAIFAAAISLRGAMSQARASHKIFDQQTELARKGAAAALAAELGSILIRLSTIRSLVRSHTPNFEEKIARVSHSYPVFQSNPSVISGFGPIVASEIVASYNAFTEIIQVVKFTIENNDETEIVNEIKKRRIDIALTITLRIMQTQDVIQHLLDIAQINEQERQKLGQFLGDRGVDEEAVWAEMGKKRK